MSRRPVPRTLRNAARAAKADRRAVEHDEAVSRAEVAIAEADTPEAAPPAVVSPDAAGPSFSVRIRPAGRAAATSPVRSRSDSSSRAAGRPRPGQRRPPTASAPARPSPWLIGAVALAVVAAGVLGVLDLRTVNSADAAREAQAAAVTDTQLLLSYDHRRIDADVAAARQRLTGSFADEYAKTSKALIPIAVQYKAVVRASVSAAGIVRADGDEAVVMLFVNQSTTSTRIQGTKVDQNRVRVTMRKVADDWRIAKVEAL